MSGIIVDCFAGGGGASTGLEIAFGRSPDIAINHDPEAIAMHEMNHPDTIHLNANIWQVDPDDIVRKHGPIAGLWASPDCTHHSKAKGGKPLKKNLRDLAWTVVLWAQRGKPEVIWMENVEEFKQWGPLDENGRPCPARKGTEFRRWVGALRSAGYKVDWWELRASDYGAPTIRKRLFVVARRDGLPITRPPATHGPGMPRPHIPVANIIDWSIPCPSIFLTREEARELYRQTGIRVNRPLVDNTLRRIAKGVKRYIIDAEEPFFVTYAQQGGANRSGQNPLHTICASHKDQNAIAVAAFMAQHNSGVVGHSLDKPLSTLTATCTQQALVAAHMMPWYGASVARSAAEPSGTITAGGGGKQALVTGHMMNLHGADRRASAVTRPLGTVCAQGNHHALVAPFLQKYYGTDQDPSMSEPLHTITTKDRFSLVSVSVGGERLVMTDIGMRMLVARELYDAQSFPRDYTIDRTRFGPLSRTSQTRMVGNSVPPKLAAAVAKANRPASLIAKEAAA